jgi:hypothetical protein
LNDGHGLFNPFLRKTFSTHHLLDKLPFDLVICFFKINLE